MKLASCPQFVVVWRETPETFQFLLNRVFGSVCVWSSGLVQ